MDIKNLPINKILKMIIIKAINYLLQINNLKIIIHILLLISTKSIPIYIRNNKK